MKETSAELGQQLEALRERVARLSAAVLRVSGSLNLETVLQEVVDSARALTGARYGLIVTVDRAGGVEEFVTSGLAPGEKDRMAAWPDGPRLFAHFRDLPGPLRVADLPAYVQALGFSTDLMQSKTMQAAPMRHRGVLVGIFFLGEKREGLEFTSADEEVLMLFAAQAATAIANARAHRDELRARADLETLIETSPVGVVVFDGGTGEVVSLNREARRIVEGLEMPGRSKEGLLELVTCRRADGREVALAEFPMAQLLGTAETVRGRGDDALGPGRPKRDDTRQRNPDLVGGRSGRAGRGHAPGPGPARGARAYARGVPRDRQPQTARPADLDQGLDGHRAGRLAECGPGRDAPVLPGDRRAGRPDARPHRRPARPRADRDGHALGVAGAGPGRVAGRPGAEHVRERYRRAPAEHRPAGGPAAGDG